MGVPRGARRGLTVADTSGLALLTLLPDPTGVGSASGCKVVGPAVEQKRCSDIKHARLSPLRSKIPLRALIKAPLTSPGRVYPQTRNPRRRVSGML